MNKSSDQRRSGNRSIQIRRIVGKHRLAVLAVLSPAVAAAAPAVPLYDGINYSSAGSPAPFLGTNSGVAGSYGQWLYQGNKVNEPVITSGSLSFPFMPPSVGNSATLNNATGGGSNSSRLYFGSIANTDSPTAYYSFILNTPTSVTGSTGSSGGAYLAGFDNLTSGTYTPFDALFIRQDATDTTKFDLGVSTTNGATTAANKVFGTTAYSPNTSLFIVGTFNFQGLASIDVYSATDAVPLTAPGSHTITSSAVDPSTVSAISNFFLRGNSGEPNGIQLDEVRIGTSWADVAAKGYYWDIDGVTPGPGGTAPSGTWDGTVQNFNSDPAGGAAGSLVAEGTRGDTLVFAAGSNIATGNYTVAVSGTRTASTIMIPTGTVTFNGNGTMAVGTFNVAAGASATVSAIISGAQTSGSVTKVGDGNVTFSAANTYAGGTVLSAGGLGIGIDSVGAGASVTSGALGTGPLTVVANSNGSNGFLFANGGPRTLGNNIVLNTSPFIISGPNDMTLAGDVSLGNGNRSIRVDANNVTFSGTISATTAVGIIKSGTGNAVLTGTNTYTGPTSIFGGVLSVSSSANLGGGGTSNNILMNGGILRTTAPVASSSRSVSLLVNSSIDAGDATAFGDVSGTASLTKLGTGTLTINTIKAPNLTISAGVVQLAPNGTAAGVSLLNTLTPGTAQLDISNNHLIVHTTPTGTFDGTSYSGVTGMVASGRNGNLWTGPGIVTSQSAAVGTNFTTIGVAQASDVLPATATATGLWAGQTITGTDTLVMYTYGGDATLDGKINVDDYIRIDSGIAAGLTGWSNGDFNYDGKVNIDDYTGFIDSNIGTQGPQLFSSGSFIAGSGSPGVSAVPEPITGSLLILPAALALARRARRRTVR